MAHNAIHQEEFEYGICKPFCQKPCHSFFFFCKLAQMGVVFQKNESSAVLSSFLCWLIIHHQKNELRTVYLSFHVIWLLIVLNCEKAMAWFLAKWFANSIFEFLVLHCIIHPIFRFISPLEVQKLEPCIHRITTTK